MSAVIARKFQRTQFSNMLYKYNRNNTSGVNKRRKCGKDYMSVYILKRKQENFED